MPRKRKSAPPSPPPPPKKSLLDELAERVAACRGLPPVCWERTGQINTCALAGYYEVKRLADYIRYLGDCGPEAVVTLPALAELVTHPGSYMTETEYRYWDWTMDENCTEVIPPCRVSVAKLATWAVARLRRLVPEDGA